MTDIYTPSPMDKKLDQAQSVFGDNPGAVAQGIAQNMTNSPTFQDSLQSQQGALSAMDQIKAYDQQLSQQYQAGNQQSMQATQANNTMLSNFASAGATPQETIMKGQQAMPETTRNTYTGFLSPFVTSALASGQQQANKDVFDMASQTRASLERAIGTEAQAYAEALRYKLQEEMAKEEQEKEKWNREYELISLTGGSIFNPWDGKTYVVPAPKTATDGTFDVLAAIEALRGGQTPTQPFDVDSRPPLESFDYEDQSTSSFSSSPNAGSSAGLINKFVPKGAGNSGGGAG